MADYVPPDNLDEEAPKKKRGSKKAGAVSDFRLRRLLLGRPVVGASSYPTLQLYLIALFSSHRRTLTSRKSRFLLTPSGSMRTALPSRCAIFFSCFSDTSRTQPLTEAFFFFFPGGEPGGRLAANVERHVGGRQGRVGGQEQGRRGPLSERDGGIQQEPTCSSQGQPGNGGQVQKRQGWWGLSNFCLPQLFVVPLFCPFSHLVYSFIFACAPQSAEMVVSDDSDVEPEE